jgi:hypothetical protein
MTPVTAPVADPVPASELPAAPAHPVRRALVRALVWIVVAVLVVLAIRVLRRVDWAEVGQAITQLAWWQMLVLLVLVAVRVTLSSGPLAFFTEGLGLRRAVANDLVGTLVATVTPAPADIVARAAMFRAWGVDVGRGLAGLVLNSILFYVVRLALPLAGAILLFWTVGDESAVGATALVSSLISALIVAALIVVFRGTSSAARLARWVGTRLRRLRPTWPGPDEVEERVVTFYENVGGRWHRFWAPSIGSLLLMACTEALILVLALRFVGVAPSQAPLFVVVGSFFSLYLLMAMPFLGLGVLDAGLVALISANAPADPSTLVAGVIVWRVCVQLVPLLAGIVPLTTLRRRGPDDPAATPPTPPTP